MEEQNDPLVGLTVQNYILERQLGQGAMGMVYLARDSRDGRKVAAKFLSGDFASKEEFVNRFMNEAAACSRLNHPNIIRVFEAGQEEGTHFMIMEYVDGVNLGYFLEVQDKVKESQALPWLKQCASALAYAHKQNIVHRDLKPENIMITKDNVVKVADLGLSKDLGNQGTDMSMTMSGTVIGTPYYISPEQARDAKRVDTRSDIYSLGATFYHLLTGRPPFLGESAAEVMSKHMNEALMDPCRINITLSDGICALIMKMMEKQPAQRFQTLEELTEAIHRLERGESPIPDRVRLKKETGETEIRPKKGPRKKALGAVLAGAVVCILGIWGWFHFSQSPPKSAPPKKMTQSSAPTIAENKGGTEKPSVETVSPPNPSATGTPPSTSPTGGDAPAPELPATAPASVVPLPPPPRIPPVAPGKTVQQEVTIQVSGSNSPLGAGTREMRDFNWVDIICLAFVLAGIPAAQQVGWVWGTIRAVAFWAAFYAIMSLTPGLSFWMHDQMKFSESTGTWFAFFGISIPLFLGAWVISNRLREYKREKDTLKNRAHRLICIAPGLAMGVSFGGWVAAFLMLMASPNVPAYESKSGSWIRQNFPSIQKVIRETE